MTCRQLTPGIAHDFVNEENHLQKMHLHLNKITSQR